MTQVHAPKPTYEELEKQVVKLRFEVEKKQIELANLKKLIFGQKSERFIPAEQGQSQDQLSLLPLTFENCKPVVKTEEIHYTRQKPQRRKAHPVRQQIPADVPRKDIIIEPIEDVTGLKKIGEEVTEELEYVPPTFLVNRYIRPKYARPNDEGVVIGLLPNRPIEKGIAGPGLLAHILVSKYVDHLPIYRQHQIFKRQGIELAESTVYDWVRYATKLIYPLAELQREKVLQTDYLMSDETPIRVLDPEKKGKTHQGYYWPYYDPVQKQMFFEYQKRHSRAGPNQTLKDFKGYLQTDGLAVYDAFETQGISLLGCMAHSRRKFFEALSNNEELASWMLLRLQDLYDIERFAKDSNFSYKERYELRQKDSVPVMTEIKEWLDRESFKSLPASAIGKAIGYTLKRWTRLERYLADGRFEIDNNLVENSIRPIALGRKNYLFAGSHDAANRAAGVYTLVTNAKLNHIDPFTYFRDILTRIADHPYKHLDQLLPRNWKASV